MKAVIRTTIAAKVAFLNALTAGTHPIAASTEGRCIVCGRKYNYTTKHGLDLRFAHGTALEGLCSHCNFWAAKVRMSPEDAARRVVYNGNHFMIGDEAGGTCRGFGGMPVAIQFKDGRFALTTNLWAQGSISDTFHEVLPTNVDYMGAPYCEIDYCPECGTVVGQGCECRKCFADMPF